MSCGERQTVTFRDLVEEAKKRIVFLVICVFGLSYLMSLTSPSVLVNLPTALILILIIRYMSLDFDMRRKAATYKGKQTSTDSSSTRKPFEGPRVLSQRSDWKHKVNSPVVEDAIEQLTRHIVSEWVTDLWYSRITPDRQGPEELVLIVNGVIGEISSRMRNINLIDLLTRDIIKIVCNRLELFRATKIKIEKKQSRFLTVEERDIELKSILAAENKLHPILFSAEAEHKVLQHVMDGLILFTFNADDLQCSLFRYITRELLACVVIRPVLNLASPRFINERLESLVISATKSDRASKATTSASQSRINAAPTILSDHSSQFPDPSVKGVELVQLKTDYNKTTKNIASDDMNQILLSKDPLLSMDTRSTRSWGSLPEVHSGEGRGVQEHRPGGEWGNVLDVFSRRKTEALAPEHFDNMWAKGKDYKKMEDTNQMADPASRNSSVEIFNSAERSNVLSEQKKRERDAMRGNLEKGFSNSGGNKGPGADSIAMHNKEFNESCKSISLYEEDDSMPSDEVDSWSSSYTEDEDTSIVTGLDTPGVKVWDAKNKRNFSHIHHPLEAAERKTSRKTSKSQLHSKRLHRAKSAKKRSRPSSQNGLVWEEVERTSFLVGEGQDVLSSSQVIAKPGDSSEEDFTAELSGRIYSGATTSSSLSFASLPDSQNMAANSAKNSMVVDPFFKLRCEVLGANIVKSGSKTFAVYSLSVTDVNNKSWSVKRRYQHFEELHRRLKDFPEYNLHLPPKHFLSTGLDIFVIQERCKLLDQYLKKLLQLPTLSCSIEVWDFLSVDSQMYVFSDSLTILETLPVNLSGTVCESSKHNQDNTGVVCDSLSSKIGNGIQDSASRNKGDQFSDVPRFKGKGQALSSSRNPEKGFKDAFQDSNSDLGNPGQKNIPPNRNLEKTADRDQEETHSAMANNDSDPTIPSEWVPPNLSVPILDLVDVILQLKDGGWIRRKAFWVAKQVLQLGMGDAFDDWLIEKIQLLRRGPVVASGIKRLEQILWPDGIFITKHPKRQRPSSASPTLNSPKNRPSTPKVEDAQNLEEMQQKEAERRAKLVYELMIDKAPAAIVGLVGRREYEQCAKDLYYFIQSSVFMKQVAFDLIELLLLSAFPELGYVFRQLNDEKEKFGEFILMKEI